MKRFELVQEFQEFTDYEATYEFDPIQRVTFVDPDRRLGAERLLKIKPLKS
jgi:hypothetical protein